MNDRKRHEKQKKKKKIKKKIAIVEKKNWTHAENV